MHSFCKANLKSLIKLSTMNLGTECQMKKELNSIKTLIL